MKASTKLSHRSCYQRYDQRLLRLLSWLAMVVVVLFAGKAAPGLAPDLESESPPGMIDHGQELMEWIRTTPGGFMHPNLVIRRVGGKSSPFFGIFATKDIDNEELLLEIPRSMVFHPDPPTVGDRVERRVNKEANKDDSDHNDEDEEYLPGVVTAVQADGLLLIEFDDFKGIQTDVDPDEVSHEIEPSCCASVFKLIREMKLGSDSRYAPYVRYLLSQPSGQLPESWSAAGQALLTRVLGDVNHDTGYTPLQPFAIYGWLQRDWHQRCGGGTDEMSELAYTLLAQRGWDEVMIPVFDMMSHRNPPYLNTDHSRVRQGDSIKVHSVRNIRAGDEIYTSYNMCKDCEMRHFNYGTPEILRDYGFVEDIPQRWHYWEPHFSFDILPVRHRNTSTEDEQKNHNNDTEPGQTKRPTKVRWNKPPSLKALRFLREQLERLKIVYTNDLAARDRSVPENEWNVIVKFVAAMISAFGDALESVMPRPRKVSALNDDEPSSFCASADGVCHISNRYPSLFHENEVWNDERPDTCDAETIYDFEDGLITIETIKSPYQNISFLYVPALNDGHCFDLDDVIQICQAYRPQYHEVMVHYAARFLPSIKRILFVGGGDSMLLHEALKYPSLEKVVGLELDQTVVRSCYAWFGTDPTFHDDRVEWWFGDATKSLTMLPADYFGSFDLVLVDLSETAQALSVTEGLSVLNALALLVSSNGILVQNEYSHFLQQASCFRNTLHVHYDGVAIVCSQSIILASNGIDFLHGHFYDHNVSTLYDLMDDEDIRYGIIRDYQRNHTNPNHCASYDSSLSAAVISQVQSPGILSIVDAEVTVDLSNSMLIRYQMIEAFEKLGLTTLSSSISSIGKGLEVISVFLNEGYVVARAWTEHKFCAIDAHLWSQFYRQKEVEESLVTMLGSTTPSTYRIVSSGIFGCEGWLDDQIRRGPQLSRLCPLADNTLPSYLEAPVHLMSNEMILQSGVKILNGNEVVALVICGNNEMECASVDAIQRMSEVDVVLVLRACDDLKDDLTYDHDGLERLLACEETIVHQLGETDKKVQAIVLDSSVQYSFAQIVASFFSDEINRSQWLDEEGILVEALVTDKSPWPIEFVQHFRREIFDGDVVFSAEIALVDEESTTSYFVITTSGIKDLPERVSDLTISMEISTGFKVGIQKIRAGNFHYQDEFEPDQIFTHDDFFQESALVQWKSQKPLGLQTVFQFIKREGTGEDAIVSLEHLKAAIQKSLDPMKYATIDFASSIANGCVVAIHWTDGHLVALWDGRERVDMNVFVHHEEGGKVIMDELERSFVTIVPFLERQLRDEQPRGPGRTIVYPKPIDDPVWSAPDH